MWRATVGIRARGAGPQVRGHRHHLPSRLANHDRGGSLLPARCEGCGGDTYERLIIVRTAESVVSPFYAYPAADHGRGPQGQADQFTVWAELELALQDELGVVRDGFIRFGRGLFREMVRQTLPPSCRYSAATVANGTLALQATPRVNKPRGKNSSG